MDLAEADGVDAGEVAKAGGDFVKVAGGGDGAIQLKFAGFDLIVQLSGALVGIQDLIDICSSPGRKGCCGSG